jgi:hypothetical protein
MCVASPRPNLVLHYGDLSRGLCASAEDSFSEIVWWLLQRRISATRSSGHSMVRYVLGRPNVDVLLDKQSVLGINDIGIET